MAVFLAATATLLLIAVAVLFSPVTIDFSLARDAGASSVDMRVRLRWMGVSLSRHPGRRRPHARQRASSAGRTVGLATIRALFLSPGFARRAGRLIAELVARARPKSLELNVRAGFDDPSDTGALLGWLHCGPIGGVSRRIHIRPDFTAPVLAGTVHLIWKRNAASLLWPMLTFAASPVVWRAVRSYFASREALVSPK